ncbi:hypothetical protein KKI24_00360 [bacterium]|nr:hypothetical protein [bacterium]
MSLVIFVSKKTVIISKYKLEFPFLPPAKNLSKAAIGAYQLIRQSESIQIESTRDEREEAITLLRQYGQELYNAIIPADYQSQTHQAGGVFIYTLEPVISEIPWELLYDGSSFFALTQGIVRINNSSAKELPDLSPGPLQCLRACLTSYAPIPPPPPGNRFINYVEGLSTGTFRESPLVDFHVNGNSSRQSVLEALERAPSIFLFSGHETEKGWLLATGDGKNNIHNWHREELEPALRKAVTRGLRILILISSRLLQKNGHNGSDPLARYFDLGIPYIISVHGRIASHRFQEYFQNFMVGLIREENILRSHRQAINSIFTSLPLSWDWSWIQLHLNQKLLEQGSESPLPPFQFYHQEAEFQQIPPGQPHHALINARRFAGSAEILNRISKYLLSGQVDEILLLQTTAGSPVEEYVQEFLRRLPPDRPFQLSLLYYQRWGYHKNQREQLPATPIGNLFPFYFGHGNVGDYFDQYVISYPFFKTRETDLKFLVIFFPPERYDASFDDWLSKKQKEGWRIIFLADDSALTRLPVILVPTDTLTASEISDAFEDEIPESWLDLVKDPLPAHFRNLALLKIAQHSRDEQIIDRFQKEQPAEKLWRKTLHTLLPTLSSPRFRIFLTLYLMRIHCPKQFLADLLSIKNIEAELSFLLRLHLISTNLFSSHIWIPINLCLAIDRYDLISEKQLLGFGSELLQRQIATLKGTEVPGTAQIAGFQYCINTLARLGQIENPLQRNLQYGRKLSRLPGVKTPLFYPNVCTSMELVLAARKKREIPKVIFSILDIISNLPLEKQTIRIYQWLLKTEEKQRNWPQVAELLMKLASVYIRLNMKEKAIGLITSVIQLNNDIKNFTHRYQNLITVALLLLDLGEIEKVRKIINNAEFDLKSLNENDVAKLWLVDGHLLFQSGKLKEAAISFRKVFKKPQQPISSSLLAKTHLNMAEIYRIQQEPSPQYHHLNQAAIFFEKTGSTEQTAQLQEQLLKICLASNMNEEAIKHLEWLYHHLQQSGDKSRTRDLADQLGGLYFKVGNREKSTHYYSVAQGM